MPRIEYQHGQPLGVAGCIYIRDVDPKYFIDKKNPARRAWFICPECGNGFITTISAVKNGHCKSCGCKQKAAIAQLGRDSAKDLTGQKSGFLTALNRTGRQYEKRGTYYWRCYCDCGQNCPLLENDRYCEVIVSDFTSKHTTKSPKCGLSSGELAINNILTSLGVLFETQYKFDDCVNPDTNVKLPFDFYLPDYNTCIEFDGEQHFKYKNNHGWNTKENYEKTKHRDEIKNKYCLENDINLIRIPYTDLEKLDEEYIFGLIDNKRKA